MAQSARALSLEVSQIVTDIQHHLRYTLGRRVESATPYEMFRALALAIRPRLVDGLIATADRYERRDAKRLYYLSLEFLIGQSLRNNLMNLGVLDLCRQAVEALGADLDDIIGAEPDAALGNGGLGRLAACFSSRWPRSACPLTATALITNTVSSNKRSTTAFSARSPTRG